LALYDLTGKSASEISALTTDLQAHYDLAFAQGAAQLTVTASGAVAAGGAISAAAAASYDAAKVTGLEVTTNSDSLNGGSWSLDGDLADGLLRAGNSMSSTAVLSGVANLLNGAKVNSGSVAMDVAGYNIDGSTGGGSFGYTLTGVVSGNVAALGVAQTSNLAYEESLAGLSSLTQADTEAGALGNQAAILGGLASETGAASMTWRVRTESDIAQSVLSDVVNLGTPTGENGFLLSMSYNEADLGGKPESGLFLGWLDGTTWVNAIEGNTTTGSKALAGCVGSLAELMAGLTEEDLPDYIGSWGVDTGANLVWAVVNHNSEFAVVPEPCALALLATGLLGLLAYAWRRRK